MLYYKSDVWSHKTNKLSNKKKAKVHVWPPIFQKVAILAP